jgi:hypothetical protein
MRRFLILSPQTQNGLGKPAAVATASRTSKLEPDTGKSESGLTLFHFFEFFGGAAHSRMFSRTRSRETPSPASKFGGSLIERYEQSGLFRNIRNIGLNLLTKPNQFADLANLFFEWQLCELLSHFWFISLNFSAAARGRKTTKLQRFLLCRIRF